MMKRKRLYFMILAFVFIFSLAACGKGQEVSLTPALTPTAEPTQAAVLTPTSEPTQSPTLTPASGPTQTLTATPAPEPTQTPALTPTPEPTQAAALTPTPELTQAAALTPTSEPTQALTATPAPEPTQALTTTPAPEPTQALTATPAPTSEPTQLPTPTPALEQETKILVAYFSATGNTGNIAALLGDILTADLYEIQPEIPYTAADLDYHTDCRANREQNDPQARPAISGAVENLAQYDTIFIGYPIWHGQAPKIISTFLESGSFSGKTLIPFCTSGSSPIGSSARNLHALTPDAVWKDGRRIASNASRSTLEDWIRELELSQKEDTMKLTIGDTVLTASLADNSSTAALKELLSKAPVTIDMQDYASMEKVGPVGTPLPRNDEQLTTGPGDIILYQGSSLVIYYDKNSWSLTPIGKIDGITQAQLKELLGDGNVTVTFSLD